MSALAEDALTGPSLFPDSVATPDVARVTGYTDVVALTADLEALAFRGWSALRTETVDGWLLRDTDGVTRRGNSVWPRGEVGDLRAALDAVARFYRQAGRAAIFQLTPVSRPAHLREVLDSAGYGPESGPTDVCVADLAGIIAVAAGRAERAVRVGGRGAAPRVMAARFPDDTWLDVAADGGMSMFGGGARAASLGVLRRLALLSAYVTVWVDGLPAGVGRGVVDGEWLGIFSMATLPAARGRGVASAVLAALATWASGLGARSAYLQVEQDGAAARSFYAALGFQPVYRYAYRSLPTGGTP